MVTKKFAKILATANIDDDLRLSPVISPAPSNYPEPTQKGIGSGINWTSSFYEGLASQRCPVCGETLMDPYHGGHSKLSAPYQREDGVFVSTRGIMQVKATDGSLPLVHCDCGATLKTQGKVLVPMVTKGAESSETKGRLTELIVGERLRALKFLTFVSWDRDSHIDILAMKDHAVVRIQVKALWWDPKGSQYQCVIRIGRNKRKWETIADDVDFVVFVGFRPIEEGPQLYVFPSGTLKGKTKVHFTPKGRYATFHNAFNQIQKFVTAKRSVNVMSSHLESRIKCPSWKAGWKKGDYAEINIRAILESDVRDFFEDEKEAQNLQFFFFLIHQIDLVVIHELCHIFHDQLVDSSGKSLAFRDDEAAAKEVSRRMVYGSVNFPDDAYDFEGRALEVFSY